MVTKTIVHFEIPASDVEALSKFYKDVFSWRFEKVAMPGMDYWIITTGPQGKSIRGGMYKKDSPQDGPRNFVQVDDMDRSIAQFKRAGGKELVGKQQIPNMGYSFLGSDPEGNTIGLFEAVTRRRRSSPPSRSKR